MTDDKVTSNTEAGTTDTTNNSVDELVRIVNTHINPITTTSPTVSLTTGSTRTYTPPLMGTSARAAKRRMDSDSGPIRIEGTDTYNQQLQHHYQNVRQILEDQQQASNVDPLVESRQSFSAKRDYFEERFKTPPPKNDTSPPQQRPTSQKILSTITTNIPDRTSSSSNESPSVDRVLEQAVELQKLSNIQPTKTDSLQPLVIERTEEYQVFLDSSNHEIRRTPSISHTSIVHVSKTGHATDLDQAQAQAERLTDDHQAIQQLTRALQEHNVTTINEYKRLPSQTNPIPSPEILQDRTNLPIASEFTVIDALLNNPLGTIDEKSNNLLNIRYNDIISNLRNPEYFNSLKEPTKVNKKSTKVNREPTKVNKEPTKVSKESTKVNKESAKVSKVPTKISKESKKKPKEKQSKKKKSSTTDTIEHAITTPLVNTSQPPTPTQRVEPITIISSEQNPLIDPKEKKKQDKENKKQAKTKTKSKPKQKPTTGDYQVIDAIIGSPVSSRLPDSYLTKYNVSAPLSLSSPLEAIPSNTVVTTTTDINVPVSEKPDTIYDLAKVVHELLLHHAAALTASVTTAPPKVNIKTEPKEPVIEKKQPAPVRTEVVHQQPLVEQQQERPVIYTNQSEIRPQAEPVKPRIVYRYIDEHGRVLKISSTPPSQLREQPVQQYPYRNTEPPYFYGRHIAVDDERRHPLPQHEQRATWQGEPKLPTTVTREDFELRDKRVPQLSEQSVPATRTIPVSFERDYSSKIPPPQQQQQQQRTYHYPNQQNVKLTWLPLSYQAEQQYVPSGTAGYDTDSTVSERSATYRPYEYGPVDSHYRYSNRPLHYNDYYQTRSPGPTYYPPPPPMPIGGRGISPDYGGGGLSRNYIEVFRGGDFRETKPSEIYSLPLSEHIRTSPTLPASNRHSRFDQYQSEKYNTITNRNNIPSSQQTYYNYSNSLPNSRYQSTVSPSNVYTSSYYTHRSPHHHHTVQSSPNPDYPTYIRQSKSFDYRPLRTKLQREYKITPNLLVDEWDYPQTPDTIKYSTTTSTTNRSGVSSPDDVFISNRTNKA